MKRKFFYPTVKKRMENFVAKKKNLKAMAPLDRLIYKVIEGRDMTDDEAERWEQYQFINSLRLKGYSRADTGHLFINRYPHAMRLFYKRWNDCNRIFGELTKDNIAAERQLIGDMLLKMYREVMQTDMESDTMPENPVPKNYKLGLAILAEYSKLKSLDKEQAELVPEMPSGIVWTNNPEDIAQHELTEGDLAEDDEEGPDGEYVNEIE